MTCSAPSSATAPVWLACLCAGWCTTCEAYRPLWQSLAQSHPEARWLWVDIEDHADALSSGPGGGPDIENFPTLLVLSPEGEGGFFGTVLPHAAVAERLLQQAQAGRLPRLTAPEVLGTAATVRALVAAGQVLPEG